MKKFLLSALAVAACATVSATDYTLDMKNAKDIQGTFNEEKLKADNTLQEAPNYKPVTALTVDGFVFTAAKGAPVAADRENSDPAYYLTPSTNANTLPTLRVYKGNTLTITAPEGVTFGKIAFTGSNATAGATVTASAGAVSDVTKTTMTWVNSEAVSSVTLTYGTNYRITSMVVSTEGGDVPVTPVDPVDPTPSTGLLEVNEFTSNFGFTFEDGTLPQGLSYVWTRDSKYNYMKASGYYKQAYAIEAAYLVSPVVDLTAYTQLDLVVNQIIGHLKGVNPADFLTYCVREEGGQWSAPMQLSSYPTIPESGNFSSNKGEEATMNFDAFAGKKIQLGFRYHSTTATAGTWEIKGVKLVNRDPAGVETIVEDFNAPAEYYNLQGVRVAEPANGIFIRRQGNKVTKVAL